MQNNLSIGEDAVINYVKAIKRLVRDRQTFDLIAAAGDSGQVVLRIASLVYSQLGIKMPQTFVAPIYRHLDDAETIVFDNTSLASEYALISCDDDSMSILFLDDETKSGMAAQGMLELLMALIKPESTRLKYTIIAEDRGFTGINTPDNATVDFISVGQRDGDVFNAVSMAIPQEFLESVEEALKGVEWLNTKQIMLTLLDLPVKEMVDGEPRWTDALLETAREDIFEFEDLQKKYGEYFEDLIRHSIQS